MIVFFFVYEVVKAYISYTLFCSYMANSVRDGRDKPYNLGFFWASKIQMFAFRTYLLCFTSNYKSTTHRKILPKRALINSNQRKLWDRRDRIKIFPIILHGFSEILKFKFHFEGSKLKIHGVFFSQFEFSFGTDGTSRKGWTGHYLFLHL